MIVLGELSWPGRPAIRIIVGQAPNALAVGADGVVCAFLFSPIFPFFFLPLFLEAGLI